MNTHRFSLLLATLALGVASGRDASAQIGYASNPLGTVKTTCLANSDTLVALPVTRPAAFTGLVTSVSGSTLGFAGSPFIANGFVYNPSGSPAVTDHFYLRVGPAAATLTGTLAVAQNSASVAGAGTVFTSQLAVGDRLTLNDGANLLTYTVTAIASNTSLTLDRAFSDTAATALTGLAATYDHSPLEGRWYAVTANTSNSVTLNLNNDNLAKLAVGTQLAVLPYATLNTVFLAANAGTGFTATTSTLSRQTQILIPNYGGTGTNLAAASVYFYYQSGSNVGWRLVGDALTTDHGNDVLMPDGYFTIRQGNGAPTVTLFCSGTVATVKASTALATTTSGYQDNAVGLIRPSDVKLGALGLGPADGSFRATTSTRTPVDRLLIYDNSTAAQNKTASAVYFYYQNGSNVGWRLTGDALTTDHSGDVIAAGSALTIRKATTTQGTSAFWTNSPNF